MTVTEFFNMHPEFRRFSDLIIQPPSYEEAHRWYPEIEHDSQLRDEGHLRTRSKYLTRLALYVISRQQGSSHSFAAACACQSFPRGMTDDVFWGGRAHFADVYGEAYYKEIKGLLAQQGVSLGAHEEYMPELAEYKGDPRAVVSRSQGRSYIKKLCEEKGWACDGGVTTSGKEPESDPLAIENCVPLADDLVRENFERYAESNPDEATRIANSDDTKDAMTDKYGAKK